MMLCKLVKGAQLRYRCGSSGNILNQPLEYIKAGKRHSCCRKLSDFTFVHRVHRVHLGRGVPSPQNLFLQKLEDDAQKWQF